MVQIERKSTVNFGGHGNQQDLTAGNTGGTVATDYFRVTENGTARFRESADLDAVFARVGWLKPVIGQGVDNTLFFEDASISYVSWQIMIGGRLGGTSGTLNLYD
jgi:hypothetical protein